MDFAAANARERRLALDFLRAGSLGALVLMRLLMEPLRQYLARQFERAGEDWDLAEQGKVAEAQRAGRRYARKFRIVVVASGEDDRFFCEQLRLAFGSARLWSIMPPSSCTVATRALAFRCLARMGCAHEKLLGSRHKGCPYKTFLLLLDPGKAAEVAGMPDCLVDPWTSALRKEYPGLVGEEVQQILYTLASLVRVDISHVESRHASVRRMLTGRSVQTHPLSLQDLSAQWVFQQHRTRRSRLGGPKVPAGQQVPPGPAGKRAAARKGVKKREKQGKTKAKRTGRGGPWRAWMRLRTRGQPFRSIDHAGEAAAYRAAATANTEAYQAAVRLGRVGTVHGRRTGRHAFGGSTSQLRLSQRRLQQTGLALQMGAWSDDAAGGALALAAHSRALGSTVEDALSVARRLARLRAEEVQGAKAAAEAAVQEYRGSIGAAAVRAIQQAVPELAAFPMRGEPAACGVHISVDMPDAKETEAAVGWVSANSHATGLAKRLEGLWGLLHRTVMEADCPDLLPPEEQSKCFLAGVCICSDSGLEFDRRVTRIRNHIKTVCPPGTSRRVDLVEGRMMLRITGRPTDYEDLLAEGGEPVVDLWLHIGLMYLSPYEPLFHCVERVQDPGEVAADPRRVYVKTTGTFARFHQGLLPLRHSSSIWCSWYRLEEAGRPVADFAPEPVPFLELANFGEARRVWPRAEAAPRAPRPRDPSADPAAGPEEGEELMEEEDALAGLDAAGAAEEESAGFLALLEPLLDAFDGPGLFGAEDAGDTPAPAVEAAPVVRMEPQEPPPVAGSQGDPVPPPMPKGRRRQRTQEQLTVPLPNGMITYYPSNGRFEAKCSIHPGLRCTLTRRGIGESASSSAPASGARPLGFLSAWLAVGVLYDDKEGHRSPEVLENLSGPDQRLYRLECRQELAQCPGAADLFERESAAEGPGLAEEPERVR